MAADGSWIDKWKKSGFCMLQKKRKEIFYEEKNIDGHSGRCSGWKYGKCDGVCRKNA